MNLGKEFSRGISGRAWAPDAVIGLSPAKADLRDGSGRGGSPAAPIRLLYVEDSPNDAELARAHFRRHAPDFVLEIVDMGAECERLIGSEGFDVLVLDNKLPDIDGIEVLRRVRAAGHSIPVVMLTGMGHQESVARALLAGADEYVTKAGDYLTRLPDLLRHLLARLRDRSAGVVTRERRILYIEPSADDAARTVRHLATVAPHLRLEITDRCGSALDLLKKSFAFDLVMTDVRIPDMDATSFFNEVRNRDIHIPFIVITGHGDEETAVALLRLGAFDYIVKRDNYLTQLPHSIDHALHRFQLDRTTKRLHADLEALNRNLELRVEARTTELRREIQERKKVEEKLRDREQQLSLIADAIPGPLSRVSADGRYLFVNAAFAKWFGRTRDEIIGKTQEELFEPQRLERARPFIARAVAGERVTYESAVPTANDGPVHALVDLIPDPDPLGGPSGHIAVSTDITGRRAAEEALVTSLREKEALLREVHHRVKNNLQVIASLLRLEARRLDHPLTISVLGGMRGRVHSMALLHETLYRSGNFSGVDLGAYMAQLANQIFRSGLNSGGRARLNLDLAPIFVDIDHAIPCGLILHELLSNSLRHAFSDRESGQVWVTLTPTEDFSGFRLTVRDNGVGLPQDLDAKRTRSLGLQLVSDLARQIQGDLEIGDESDSRFVITIKRSPASSGFALKNAFLE